MDSNQLLVKPDTAVSDKKASEALAYAQALVIASNEEYSRADAYCRGLFKLRKEIEGDFKDSVDKAKATKKAATEALATLVEQQEGHTLPVFQAEKVIKGKMLIFSQAEERKRQEAEAKASEEARRFAEDEQIRKATLLEAQGKPEKAQAMLERPVKVAPVVIPPSTPKAATTIRQITRYEIIDAEAVKREFCEPAAGKIRQAVNLYGEKAVDIVGGIRVWQEAA